VKPEEQSAKSASTSKTGLFATLRGLLHIGGTGAPETGRRIGVVSVRRSGRAFHPLSRLKCCVPALLFAVVGLLSFTVAPAVAGTVHTLSGTFTGSGASALSEPAGVAVNDETGDVYVVDKGHDRVEEFNSTGTAVLAEFNGSIAPTGALSDPEEIAVDNSTNPLDPSAGDVYVTDTGHSVIDKFSSSGTYLGQITTGKGGASFEGLNGVAVDPEGRVWVYQSGGGEIDSYSNALTNAFVSSFGDPFGERKPGLAVDSEDDLYLTRGGEHMAKLSSSGGELIEEVDAEPACKSAVNLDPASSEFDDVYVYNRVGGAGAIRVFNTAGNAASFIEEFTAPNLTSCGHVAVNSSDNTVYVVDAGAVDILPFVTLPDVTAEEVSNAGSKSITLNGAVDPEGIPITSCEFEYGVGTSYGATAECAPKPGSTEATVAANLSGLLRDTTYHYRLVAGNANGRSYTPDQEFTTRGAGISEEQVTNVEATGATLQADIDPNESETTYHFEYDTTPYTSSAPHGTGLPAAKIPSGDSPVAVTAQLTGLQPNTTYYYRVVVESESLGTPETFDGPGEAFTTSALPSSAPEACPNAQLRSEQPYGPRLPDCRAYELVSPLEKGDDGVLFSNSRASVSDAAPAISYVSRSAFAEPQSKILEDRYISRREPDGWSTTNISPPYKSFGNDTNPPFIERFFTPELSKGVLYSANAPLVAGQPEGYQNLYLANLETRAYEAVTVTPPFPEVEPFRGSEGHAETAGVSTDLSHIVFNESASLLEGAPPEREHVYEWTGGKLTLVDVSPEGTPFAREGERRGEGANAWVGADGVKAPAQTGDTWNAVSADGSRVFFTESNEGEEGRGQLFVRENAERPQSPVVEGKCAVAGDACTAEVSRSQKTNGTGPGGTDPHGYHIFKGHEVPTPAFYRDASTDGARAFFMSRVELTNDANTGPEDNAANLYEYDVATGWLRDLTVDTNAGDPNGAAVLGLVTASDDGSYVYFVAEGDLAGAAVSGQPNLYLYHGGSVTFIATLAQASSENRSLGGDSLDWLSEEVASESSSGPSGHTARVTADGVYLAFESQRPLTGYDNGQSRPGACEASVPQSHFNEDGNCHEVFVYDAQTGHLVCASCNQSGARPIGGSTLGGEQDSGGLQSSDRPFYLAQNLSEGGGRLFFQSRDALVPKDGNGLLDVYEWERAGVGSCTESSPSFSGSSGGCVFAISNVSGSNPSYFMDATPSGENVFIATRDALVPAADGETRSNVYDVRVDGGFPVSVAPPVCSNADSCKPPASPQPGVFGVPSSATFSGPGDTVPAVSPPAVVKSKAKSLTRAQKLAAALRSCRKDKKKSKRQSCEKQARAKYGPTSKTAKTKKASRDRRGK
jgi:hypothetical protein